MVIKTKKVSIISQAPTSRSSSNAPAKRSQHANATCRNIVGRNMLRAFGHRVAKCCDLLGVAGSNLTIFKPQPNDRNMATQHVATLGATCCAQQCCDMLRWHVAIVWPGLLKLEPTTPNMSQHTATRMPNACNMLCPTMLRHVALVCCDRLAGA